MVRAEFFDVFGFIGFLILLFIGISIVDIVKIEGLIIIIISSVGLIVDGYIVVTKFILKNRK
ncbi:hypothetical protein HY448_01845 [Candidatus Pacearchaeota archaeon]|nr:hypothetical protein [Candidatus Pacearchaeota archaeon]